MPTTSKDEKTINKKALKEILWKDKLCSDFTLIDKGITEIIKKINIHGYETIMSCSGMEKDHEPNNHEKCPYICFNRPPLLENGEIKSYIRFLGDCLYNSNWFVEIFTPYVVGYLPKKLSDEEIKSRFQKLSKTLKLMDYFKHSY